MFLTKRIKLRRPVLARLASHARHLPNPDNPLHGVRRQPPPLPENIICFQRRSDTELNRSQQGRAMHHRHVLIVPLRGKAVVCVDDVELPIAPGRGVVLLPYQYHHYIRADRRLHWLFITFEYAQGVTMEPLRNSVFSVGAALAAQLEGLLRAHRYPSDDGMPELRLALLLAQLPTPPGRALAPVKVGPTLALQVNHAVQKKRPLAPSIRELAADIGMSPSNLRARFRASCGVSLGRHMRKLRMERACGLLRMTPARISEIAEQCGFTSVFSFSRAFRTHYGTAPSDFRRQQTLKT